MAAVRLKMPLILSGKRGHGAGGIAFDSKRYIKLVGMGTKRAMDWRSKR